MATLNTQRISRRTVEALPVGEREALYWDSELSGFGIRVYPSGSKVYLVQTRKDGRSRRLTVGRHGLISADRAHGGGADHRRHQDRQGAASRQPRGSAGDRPTVAEVAARYMREHVEVRCKPTAVRQCRHTLDHHLLPALGAEPLGAIGRDSRRMPMSNDNKGLDARWAKKSNETHYGYKNHICVDNKHKLIRPSKVTSAEVHVPECSMSCWGTTAPRTFGQTAFTPAHRVSAH